MLNRVALLVILISAGVALVSLLVVTGLLEETLDPLRQLGFWIPIALVPFAVQVFIVWRCGLPVLFVVIMGGFAVLVSVCYLALALNKGAETTQAAAIAIPLVAGGHAAVVLAVRFVLWLSK